MLQAVAPTAPVFVGLDLAWSRRNRTGGAVIQNGMLIDYTGLLGSDEEIVKFVAAHLPAQAPAVLAVDAPLWVPNATGRRRCDAEVSAAWAAFEAGAYPANRQLLLSSCGSIRGEELAALFAEHFGFVQAAPLPFRGEGRLMCEVFPHPAHASLFGLQRTLKYKRKSGRSPEAITAEFSRYQQLLAGLAQFDPPLAGLEDITAVDASAMRGKALQELEETLDAVTCAYVAWYGWWHGPERQRVYGSVSEGHILAPLLPESRGNAPPGNQRKER